MFSLKDYKEWELQTIYFRIRRRKKKRRRKENTLTYHHFLLEKTIIVPNKANTIGIAMKPKLAPFVVGVIYSAKAVSMI